MDNRLKEGRLKEGRLKKGRLRRGLLAVAWTLAFVATVYGMDRLILGERPVVGWIEVLSIDDVPNDVVPVVIPAYLPNTLVWPASRILYRAGDDPGWWVGVRGDSDSGEELWFGIGTSPPPESLGDTVYCLDVATDARCPDGWFALSTSVQGRVLFLVSRFKPRTAREILMGLRLAIDE